MDPDPDLRRRAATLCAAVLEQNPEGRGAFLDDACRTDADLRRLVEWLLAEHARAGSPYWR